MQLKNSLSQKQLMQVSPAFLQSLKVLQMGTLELTDYVNNTVIENPLLETSFPDIDARFEEINAIKWISRYSYFRAFSSEHVDSKQYMESLSLKVKDTLQEHLMEQINPEMISHSLEQTLKVIIYELNDNGYFEESDAAYAARYSFPEKTVHDAVSLIQQLDPPGVGAHNLAEQLSLQLRRFGKSKLAITIAEDHLDDMARGLFNKISKATGASRASLQMACDEIRSMDPRPCASFSRHESATRVSPDVIVDVEDGVFKIIDLTNGRPELHLNSYYCQMLESSTAPEVTAYLKEKLTQAQKLINDIESRTSAMIRCVKCITEKQRPFFTTESNDLFPMTYDNIAQELGVYESTVSRIVNSKYLLCSKGLFPLKYFFSTAITNVSGSDVSNKSVKSFISDLVDSEDKRSPLSDQDIADMLREKGIVVARRTVAKYREELNIPSTRGRKRL